MGRVLSRNFLSHFVLLLALKGDNDDAVGVCITVVELQLDTEVIVPFSLYGID